MATQRYTLGDEIAKQVNPLQTQALGYQPQQYRGTFEQAYKGLEQGPNAPEEIIASGTNHLADAFIERFYERNGKLPDVNQIKDFVAANLDQGFASSYIKGSLNADQIKSQMVDPYLQGNNMSGNDDATGVEGRMKDLGSKLEEYYKGAGDYATENINTAYNKNKINVANDLAGAGLLSQPVSRYSLNDLEGQRGAAIGNAQATLASQKAAGQTDLSKTIESILAGQRSLDQNANQFGQTLRFSKDQYQNTLDLENRKIAAARELGKKQAEANEPGTLDYINTGFNGLRAIGSLAGGFSGKKG